MSNVQIQQVFQAPDGTVFTDKKEAQDYIRRPKIAAALSALTDGNTDLVEWLINHQDDVEMAFEAGTIKRVTKQEAKKLAAALEAIKEAGNPKFAFVADNVAAIVESFRWPSVKRMSEEEKATAARNTLLAYSDGNEELADWILANKDAVLTSFDAGIEKRAVNPAAAEALKAYREQRAAEKKAREEAAAAG